MELDEEVVFGLGGLQLDRERAEAEAAEEEEDEDGDVDMVTLPPVSIILPPSVSSPPQATPTETSLKDSQTLAQPTQKSLFRQSSELGSLVGGVPLWDSKQPLPQLAPVLLSEVTYHPVVLDEWEDRIIWDPPVEEKMEEEENEEEEDDDEDDDDEDDDDEESDTQRVPTMAIEYDRGGKHAKWGVLLSDKPKHSIPLPASPDNRQVDEPPPPGTTFD